MPGINRALASPRLVTVKGVDIDGTSRTCKIRVCDVGPFLVLKLRAFFNRLENKDAFDIFHTLRQFVGGTGNAITAFATEMDAGNPAFPDALACLRKHYHDESAAGPVATAIFIEGPKTTGEPQGVVLRRRQVQQEAVDGAMLLLRACT